MLTDVHLLPSGGQIWLGANGTIAGRVHTNGRLRFFGSPVFSDVVSSTDSLAWYYNYGSPRLLADDHNGVIDVPVFPLGFLRGAPRVPLPENDWVQQNAALGLAPEPMEPSNATIRTQLGLGPETTPPPNGVYVVHASGSMTGGIYVQGDADSIVLAADTSNGLQILHVAHGTMSVTVTIDPAAASTSVHSGATTTVYTGVPRGVLFVNGAVLDLRGPGRAADVALPALASGQRLLLAARGDIVIQGDVTVHAFESGGAVLGVIASGGSVRIGTGAPDDLALDAFVMAIGASGAFSVDGYAAHGPRGVFRMRGGCVSRWFGAFSTFRSDGSLSAGYAREFRHDDRGLIPPHFPAMPTAVADAAAPPREPALRMSPPFPNPTRDRVRMRYMLPRSGRVTLTVLDALGRRVATLVGAEQPAGEHEATWDGLADGGSLARPGFYLVLLRTADGATLAPIVRLQ